MHTFKKGDAVAIINQTMSGKFFVEGRATIVRPVTGVEGQYVVKFSSPGDTAERFVDPAAQADPAAFVANLNTQIRGAFDATNEVREG